MRTQEKSRWKVAELGESMKSLWTVPLNQKILKVVMRTHDKEIEQSGTIDSVDKSRNCSEVYAMLEQQLVIDGGYVFDRLAWPCGSTFEEICSMSTGCKGIDCSNIPGMAFDEISKEC
ncbi:hypothetical protein ElyMa_004253600 [Elysia marginata]|uniref:Uncharacterized protein n=1 Tax=Elysia marginata TaxID=1093978 RepID=A0AAV4GRM1_9GAST|nr:hypothetical protein ElyMa_004253600 [Elysia marginata]